MWEKVKLGDVIEKTETVNPTSKFPSDSFEYIDVSSVNKERLAIEETQTLLGKDAPSRARRKIQKDDIIFATVRPTLKRVAVVPMELDGQICSTGYIVLRVKKDVLLPRYLFHWMTSKFVMDYVESIQTGASYPAVTDKQVKDIDIQFPPLEEQERIVAKLDAAFAEIDEAISEVEAKENEVQKLKASLLSSSLNSDAVTWSTAKLGEICILNYGKGLDKKDRSENAVIPVYGANGIKAYTDKLLHDKPSIIIGRKGSAGELNKVTKPFWALDVTYYVTTDESIVDIDFLFYALATLNLPSMARGIKPGINRNDVYNKSIKLPPLAEQERIVTKLDAANSEFKNANEAIIKSKANYLALKSAILAKELQSSEAA